jgi:hypothetical protein
VGSDWLRAGGRGQGAGGGGQWAVDSSDPLVAVVKRGLVGRCVSPCRASKFTVVCVSLGWERSV